MDTVRLQALEMIGPFLLAPWRTSAFAEIDFEPDREKAKEKATSRRAMAGITVFPDALGQHNQVGAAAVAFNRDLQIVNVDKSASAQSNTGQYAAKLSAIHYAIGLVYRLAQANRHNLETTPNQQRSSAIAYLRCRY
jgi:hypothetical protein